MKELKRLTIWIALAVATVIAGCSMNPADMLWDIGKTYARGERVTTHPHAYVYENYESLRGGNLGHEPKSSPEWWAWR
jgi:hypothetical protein